MDNDKKKKYNAFWAHDFDERAALHITVPSPASWMQPPDDVTKRWEDTKYRMESFKQFMNNSQYFAEGYPNAWINIGPGVLAAILGSDYTYYPYTVWFGTEKFINDWSDAEKIQLLPDNRMYNLLLKMTEDFCKDSSAGKTDGGSYIIGMTDLGGTMDILASFRGTEQLLFDLLEEPEAVEKAAAKIDGFWETAFTKFYSLLEPVNQGMSAWMPIWCPKRWYPLQCDFSAMISPDHFERFVMPSLVRGANFLDYSIYHLDGVGEMPHVDLLLSIDRLDGIQWTPGAGKPGCADDGWFPLYEKIQSKGKCLVLLDVNSSKEMLYILKNLSHKGLYIYGSLGSAEEAQEVVRKAVEYAK